MTNLERVRTAVTAVGYAAAPARVAKVKPRCSMVGADLGLYQLNELKRREQKKAKARPTRTAGGTRWKSFFAHQVPCPILRFFFFCVAVGVAEAFLFGSWFLRLTTDDVHHSVLCAPPAELLDLAADSGAERWPRIATWLPAARTSCCGGDVHHALRGVLREKLQVPAVQQGIYIRWRRHATCGRTRLLLISTIHSFLCVRRVPRFCLHRCRSSGLWCNL